MFGRNTSAGAVSIVTAGPEFDTGMWDGSPSAGNLGYAAARVGGTTGLTDTFAVRFDGTLKGRDGYITDLISRRRHQHAKPLGPCAAKRCGTSRTTPASALSWTGQRPTKFCCAVTPISYGVTQGAIEVLHPGATVPLDPESRSLTVTPGRDYREAVEEWGASAQLDWDLGGINLTSITALSRLGTRSGIRTSISASVDIGYRDGLTIGFESFTQEIRLQGEWGRLNWLIGGFYGDETLDTTDRIRLGADVNNYINVLTMAGTAGLTTAPHPLLGGISGPAVDRSVPILRLDCRRRRQPPTQSSRQSSSARRAARPPWNRSSYFAGLGGYKPVPERANARGLQCAAAERLSDAGGLRASAKWADNWTVGHPKPRAVHAQRNRAHRSP